VDDVKRFELPDGDWYELYRRPSTKRVKAILRARRDLDGTPQQDDVLDVTILQMTARWRMTLDGRELPLDREGIADLPFDVSLAIVNEAATIFDAVLPRDDANPNA